MIYALVSLAALIIWVAWAGYQQGKNTEKGEQDAEILDDVQQAKILRDKLHDPIEFERVSDRFNK